MVQLIGGSGAFRDDAPDAWPLAVKECVPILEELPEHLRVDAASVLYTDSRVHSNPDIPWAVIFSDETPEWIGAKLLSTCVTPSERTPSHNLDLRPTVDAIGSLLKGKINLGPDTTALARRLIQIAAGKPDTPFKVYADDARMTPMKYGWSGRLAEQFGETGSRDILTADERLARIVGWTEALTGALYDTAELSYEVHPDSDDTLVHGFLPDDDRYVMYVSAAHQLRGLEF